MEYFFLGAVELSRDSKLPQRMIRSQVYKIQQRKMSDSAQILGNEMLKSSAMERVLGVLVDGKLDQPGGTSLSWGHQAQHHWLGQRGIVPPCSGLGWPHLGIVSRFGHQNIRKT